MFEELKNFSMTLEIGHNHLLFQNLRHYAANADEFSSPCSEFRTIKIVTSQILKSSAWTEMSQHYSAESLVTLCPRVAQSITQGFTSIHPIKKKKENVTIRRFISTEQKKILPREQTHTKRKQTISANDHLTMSAGRQDQHLL